MQLADRPSCVTDLAFDAWFARECSAAQQTELEGHLHGCTRCRLRAELFERERKAFLEKAPSLAANARLAGLNWRPDQLAGERRGRVWLPLSAAALVALAALLSWLPAKPQPTPTATGERAKGSSQVGFYIKRGGRVQLGASGDTAYPGDLLRFTVSSTEPVYFALLGRDARSVSVHFPAEDRAAHVRAGRDLPLDFSLELDAQLGPERLFAVLCPSDYAPAALRAELQELGELRAPAGCRVERFELHKQAPR